VVASSSNDATARVPLPAGVPSAAPIALRSRRLYGRYVPYAITPATSSSFKSLKRKNKRPPKGALVVVLAHLEEVASPRCWLGFGSDADNASVAAAGVAVAADTEVAALTAVDVMNR